MKKIKLVRSLIGSKKDQIATAYSLGLHKIGDESVQPGAATSLNPCVACDIIRIDNGMK